MLFKESIKRFTPPKGWGWASISDVAKLSFSSVDKKSVEGEKTVRLCNYMDVFYNRRIREGMPFMASTASDSDIKKFTLNKDDVVLTKDSETPEEIAFAAVIDEQIDNLVCGYHLAVLRPDQAKVTGEYLMSAVNFHPNHHQFVRLANGATRFGLGIDSLNNALIPLPPLAEQRKIAEILRTWDEAIETAEAELKAKQDRKRVLMQKLLMPSAEGAVRGSKVKKNSEIFLKSRIREVAELKNGYAFKVQQYDAIGPYRVITISNVQDGRLDTASCKFIKHTPDDLKQHQRLAVGDVLISMTGNVGRVCRVNESGLLLNQRVGRIIPKHIDDGFFYYVLASESFRDRMVELAQGGAQPNLAVGDILDYVFVHPSSLQAQQKIAEILQVADGDIELINNRIESLRVQKRGLMQKLLTGEVRVAA
jgi:type I restriction enzyme S subunit